MTSQVQHLHVQKSNRVPSGIHGLDRLIQGGFLKGSVNLVTGGTGTGKTIFCSQFLWQGLQRGESAVYISLEQSPEEIRDDMLQFGWDFAHYEKKDLCKIIFHDPAQISNISSIIITELRDLDVRRLVIDSVAVMGIIIGDKSEIRRRIFNLLSVIKTHRDCTTLLTTEIPEGSQALSRFGVEEFVVDGVIVLNYLGIGAESNRSLLIRKMRRTKHGKDVYPFEIEDGGIVIKEAEI